MTTYNTLEPYFYPFVDMLSTNGYNPLYSVDTYLTAMEKELNSESISDQKRLTTEEYFLHSICKIDGTLDKYDELFKIVLEKWLE